MHVLLVTHYAPPIHGQAIQTGRLLEASKEWAGIELDGINTVYAEDRAKLKGFEFGKICRLAKYAWSMLRYLKKKRSEVLILTPAFFIGPFLKDSLLVWLARSFSPKTKIVAWVHMDPVRLDYESRPKLLRWYIDQTLRQFSRFVCCAPSLKNAWPKHLQDYVIEAVSNGVPDVTNESFALPGHREVLRVMYLSAIDVEKGWLELFHCAERICASHDDVEFFFYGGIGAGVDEVEVNDRFANSEFPNRIKRYGGVWGDEKSEAYRQADVFCFPSHTEAFPLTVLEAMSFGLPIVASKVGAIADALDEPAGGRLVEPCNRKQLQEALVDVINKPDQIVAMGHHNRECYLEHFNMEAFSKSWRRLLLATQNKLSL